MFRKRGNGEGSVTKRKDGRWECAIMLGYQKDGRRLRKSFYGKTRKEAVDKMHAFMENRDPGFAATVERPEKHPTILFSDWADTWFERHKDNISKTTQQSYKYTLGNLVYCLSIIIILSSCAFYRKASTGYIGS